MCAPLAGILLCFAAEGTAIRSGVQRLAALPAEARLGRFPRLEAGLDLLDVRRGVAPRPRRPAPAAAAGGELLVEQLARTLVTRGDLRRPRLEDDVVDRLWNLGVL